MPIWPQGLVNGPLFTIHLAPLRCSRWLVCNLYMLNCQRIVLGKCQGWELLQTLDVESSCVMYVQRCCQVTSIPGKVSFNPFIDYLRLLIFTTPTHLFGSLMFHIFVTVGCFLGVFENSSARSQRVFSERETYAMLIFHFYLQGVHESYWDVHGSDRN